MNHARFVTPGGSHTVRADGTGPLPWAAAAAAPMLHLLPTLRAEGGTAAACPTPHVSCTAAILYPATRWQMPQEALVVRQLLPNLRFLVAGTLNNRRGFMVPLPPTLPEEVVVRFEWRLADAAQAAAAQGRDTANAVVVDHVIRLRLRPTGRGQVFSMDTAAWPDTGDAALAPCEVQPFAVLNGDSLQGARRSRVLVLHDPATGTLLLDESLDMPGIPLSEIWTLSKFEREQLHEAGQTVRFDPASSDTLAHRANACAEMPPGVLVEAVRLARDVPFGEGTPYAGSVAACERHPALLALCGWWNGNAPEPLHRRAGLCGIDVRVRDDGEYWHACHETSNRAVDYPVKTPEIAARVGDVVLVEFHQGQHAATFTGGRGCELWDVAGNPWQTTGVSEGEVRSGASDEGWFLLSGLAAFPERFPVAWKWLIGDDIPYPWDQCAASPPSAGPGSHTLVDRDRPGRAAPGLIGGCQGRDLLPRVGLGRMLLRACAHMASLVDRRRASSPPPAPCQAAVGAPVQE